MNFEVNYKFSEKKAAKNYKHLWLWFYLNQTDLNDRYG